MASFEERFGPGLWASVVIATFNRQDSLRRLLGQLGDQTLDPSRYEIIAIDDGSQDLTARRALDAGAPIAVQTPDRNAAPWSQSMSMGSAARSSARNRSSTTPAWS